MKITLAQLDYTVGDIDGNVEKIITTANNSKGSSLVVFSELAVCGCPPLGLVTYDSFVEKCEKALDTITQRCPDVPILVGCPIRNDSKDGGKPFNAAVFMFQNQRKIFRKNQLTIEEMPYFEAGDDDEMLKIGCMKVAVTIGSDLQNRSNDEFLIENRMDSLMKNELDIIINIAADIFDYQRAEKRREELRKTVLKFERPLFFVNQVGANCDLIFDGGSAVFGYEGYVVNSLPFFKEDVKDIDLQCLISLKKEDEQQIPSKVELMHDALVLGISDFFKKQGFKRAVLGLSGGLDSALVMALTAEAIGNENVTAVLMPSQFSTDHSVNDAKQLAEKLGSPYYIVPIKNAFDTFSDMLKPVFQDRPFDVTEENLQARCRGILVMAVSNKFGNILLNTSNKSEASVGYGTLYGDLCGSLSVIGDVYKTEAYEISRYINRDEEIIPWHTIEKAPSAELRPDQKDTDSLPDYSILDAILYQYNECAKDIEDIVNQGFDRNIVERVVKMVNRNDFKRKQLAPVLGVSPRPFAKRLMPIVKK